MSGKKALWEEGEFTQIAASMRERGEDMVRQAGIAFGMRVLGLGCGDGATAIPAAKLGADVLGMAIASNRFPAGNRRAAQAGLSATCCLVKGVSRNLSGVHSKRIDRVIGIFGAMFAPKPFDEELLDPHVFEKSHTFLESRTQYTKSASRSIPKNPSRSASAPSLDSAI